MRLVAGFDLSARERQQAWPSDQALERVRQALLDRQSIEGLDVLRASLLIDLDTEVLGSVERGDWWLIRPEADYVESVLADRAFDPAVMALMQNPPAQPARSPTIYRLVESETGEPLAHWHYTAVIDGEAAPRKTDGRGIAHLFVSADAQVSMAIRGE